MNVLVTGGAGYIGSHTAKALSLAGHTPITIDNLVYGHESAVKWGPFFRVDINDEMAVAKILRTEKIEAVIHFAAYAYVGESMREPLKYFSNNVGGTLALLRAMRAANVLKIVFSSSCATYGTPTEMPISENCDQRPINPYGLSKLMVEEILKAECAASNVRAIALRYFNAAGADADCEIGEDHTPETHIVPLAIQAYLDPNKPLTIFGQDYDTADGTCVRDYIHVTDLADAHVKALEHLSAQPKAFTALNLGAERGVSVKEIVRAIEKVGSQFVGGDIRKLSVLWGERRPGDPAQLIASATRAREVLGWQTRHSGLENIISTAMHWATSARVTKQTAKTHTPQPKGPQ